MLSWLKDKTFGKLQRWFSEKINREFQALHNERFQEMAKNLPKELVGIQQKLEILNDNSWANHHLYKRAMGEKKYQEAFQYFFFGFELNLKHLIMSEMAMKNALKTIEDKKLGIFPIYSEAQIFQVQEMGDISTLIKQFCGLYGNQASKELWQINRERNFIIHNMMKKKLTEKEIKNAFENFFVKNRDAIVKVYSFFDSLLAERPSKMLKKLEEASK